MPAIDAPASSAAAAVQGIAWRRLPSLSITRVPVPWSILPATKNSGALYSACASSSAPTATDAPSPFRPTSVTRVPSVATVDQARMRLRSRSRSASTMPQAAVTEPTPLSVHSHASQSPKPGSSRASR